MANVISILIQAKDEASAVLAGVKEEVSRLSPSFAQSATASRQLALGLGLTTVAAGGLVAYGAHVAGNLEAWHQGFVTLLGSTQAANDAIKMIQKDAAATPFEMTGLVQANMLLTSVTHNAGQSESLLMNVGKALAAMGKGQPELDRVVINLQQIGAIGHAQMMDLKQFAYDGIPIFDMLKKQTGLAGDALDKFISSGGVTFQMLTDMFNKAGSAGGQFATAFTSQAGTFNQLWSNMKDNFNIFAANLVEKTGVFDALKRALADVVNYMTAHQDDFVRGVRDMMTFIQEHGALVVGIIGGALAPAFISLGLSIASATWALAPWIAAGVVVALTAQYIHQNFDELSATVTRLWQSFTQLTPVIVVAQYFQQVLWPALQAVAAAIWQNLAPALGQLWDAVVRLWNALQPALLDALRILGIILAGALFAAIWLVISALNVAVQIFAAVVSAISNVINWISNLIAWFGNLVGVVWNTVGSIAAIFSNLVPAMRDVGNILIGVITAPFRSAYDSIVGLFRGLPGEIGSIVRGAFGSVGSAISGTLHSLHIPGFATGTTSAPGGLALVGERGPELVNLPRGSQVYTASQTAQMAGGTTNILSGNFTFNNKDAVDAFFNRLDKTQRLATMGLA